MNAEKTPFQTTMLLYDVIGKICPGGMTNENCPLRKKLAEIEEEYKIGYHVLENGNLLVPSFWSKENDMHDEHFNLKDIKVDICAECARKNREQAAKESEKPLEKPQIQTVIFSYTMCGVNCPSGMDRGNCPLRKELAEKEERYDIGYASIGEKTLLIPKEHFDVRSNNYQDVWQRTSEICDKCFEQNRQTVKE